MSRKLMFAAVMLAALCCTGRALAFTEPNADEVFKKIRKSVIKISNISIESPYAGVPTGSAGGGSGVVFQIDYDKGVAYALTNHHVSGAAMINAVRFWDGAQYKAYMIGDEPGIDVALLEIQGIPDERGLPDSEKTITASSLGDSDAVMIGEYGVAMGAPGAREGFLAERSDPLEGFMLQQTITMRVVSGKATDPTEYATGFWGGWKNDLGQQAMTNLPWSFVTQSAINGGNSGGPLFNSRGEVIGLNHANAGLPKFLSQNQNYTIPINFAKNFAYQILNTGKYEVPWLGMDVLFPPNYTNGMQVGRYFEEVYDPKHLEVLGVRRDSPAQRAGVQQGDTIVEFDGQTFPTINDLRSYIFALPIGKQIPVTFKRNHQKVKLVLETAPKRNYDSEFSF